MSLQQIVYKINIELESGLHIGGGDSTIEIGGIDNKVIREHVSNEPYIPGSSLKGKIRFLLEETYGKENQIIKKLFGVGANDRDATKYRLTRLQFVDVFLTKSSKDTLDRTLGKNIYTVVKYENSIKVNRSRINTVPRPIERVPKGSVFSGVIILNLLDNDTKAEMLTVLEKGISLLNKSYLGGSGSRGHGKVKASITEEK